MSSTHASTAFISALASVLSCSDCVITITNILADGTTGSLVQWAISQLLFQATTDQPSTEYTRLRQLLESSVTGNALGSKLSTYDPLLVNAVTTTLVNGYSVAAKKVTKMPSANPTKVKAKVKSRTKFPSSTKALKAKKTKKN